MRMHTFTQTVMIWIVYVVKRYLTFSIRINRYKRLTLVLSRGDAL